MLSICICSLHSRTRQLAELMEVLRPQANGEPVEVLIETDGGHLPIGEKRNRLLQKAKGKFIAFVDDDDMVSPAYVSLFLSHVNRYFNEFREYPDCVGMVGVIQGGRKDQWQFRHSITVDRWCKDKTAHLFFRTPNHLNPIRSDHAKKCVFPPTNWGEDKDYSDQVRKYLKTETFIETPIYFYKMENKV